MAKVNVSLPEKVLADLDKAAREAGASRSSLLAEAVRKYLAELEEKRKLEQRRQAARSIDRFREKFGGWDGTAEILKWRDRH